VRMASSIESEEPPDRRTVLEICFMGCEGISVRVSG
jgi:hypothetical protein